MMSHSKFDPHKYHRRSIRLLNYDYSQPGAYYITIVTWHRESLFGRVVNGGMMLNKVGHIVRNERDLQDKTDYINANPSLWDEDSENPKNIQP